MPTGVALQDVRRQLFEAAERVLLRDGPNALTSRAVTEEAGCAKGVLHRHFADFDAFLAELVRERIARLDTLAEALREATGTGTDAPPGHSTDVLTDVLTDALTDLFDPVAVAVVSLVISRDVLRTRLRETTPAGIPLLTEATAVLTDYLTAERARGRITAAADPAALAAMLIGTAHLLYADRTAPRPDRAAVHRAVAGVLAGVTRPR